MGDTWRALNSLSRTMRDRGGVSDALLRGVDATTGFEKVKYDIARGKKADLRADEIYKSGAAKRDYEQRQYERLNKPTRIPQSRFMAPTPPGLAHFFSKDKNGVSNYDMQELGLPGSQWLPDETGVNFRADKDGKFIEVPQLDYDRFAARATQMNIARLDPRHFLGGEKLFGEMRLQDIEELTGRNSPEYIEAEGKVQKIGGILNDKKQMAELYGNQAIRVYQELGKLIAEGADPKFIKFVQDEVARTETKFKELNTGLTKKEQLENDKTVAEIAKLKAQTKEIEEGKEEKPDYTPKERGDLVAKAYSILNKELELIQNMPNWRAKTPEQQAAWKENKFTEILKRIMPAQSATEGLENPATRAKAFYAETISRGDDPEIFYRKLKASGHHEEAAEFKKLMPAAAEAGSSTAQNIAPQTAGLSRQTQSGIVVTEKDLEIIAAKQADWAKRNKKTLDELNMGNIDTTLFKDIGKMAQKYALSFPEFLREVKAYHKEQMTKHGLGY